ncbi:MAG: BspA family leucine-rich repeat surface protein, partial [Ekhidna sp.]|nr:BspA family leucine-rich repeat surface protein [Ekhidna sp.]
MNRAFSFCNNLTIAEEAGIPNLSNVTDMTNMFTNASVSGDLSDWDVSKVTSMGFIFSGSDFNGDISEWDVSKVTDMLFMFWQSSFNQDISEWNTSNVKSMWSMFRQSSFNQDISRWNVSKVTNMSSIFSNSSFNGDLSEWNVSKVTNMNGMFNSSSFNGDLSKWDVSKVTNMSIMFQSSDFNGDLSKWDISKVTNMSNMFLGNSSMSSENYDKLLIGWSTLDMEAGETKIPNGIIFAAPDHYTCASEAARSKLIKDYSWSITGDSKRADAIDPTPDAMTLKALTVDCGEITSGDDLNLKAPTATDNCDGSIKGSHNITDFPITSEITITWTFTDEVDNTAAQTQTVTIGDTEAPEVTGTLPEVTAQCPIGALEELEKPDAPADNCKGTVTVALKTGTPFPIQAGTTTITWVYTDEAGNTSEQTQDVTIEDNTDPLPGMDLEALTVDCGEITSGDDLNLKAPTATDNCDGSIKGSHNITDFPITSEITITWTFTDEAG